MNNPAVRFNYQAGIVGVMSLLSLLIINLVTSATNSKVWLFGSETHIGCWFKEKYGVPCPLCGMTRSIILTLHGNIGEAFQMHIGGPLAIFGILIFGFTMLAFALPEKSNKFYRLAYNPELKVLTAITIYFVVITFISFVYWLLRLYGYFTSLPELL
jgi:Protein of unknown function (DUF2752)